MFKPVPMSRLRAILLEEDERAVLWSLGQRGIVHLTRTPAGPNTAPLQPYDGKAELDRTDDLLERCRKLIPNSATPEPEAVPLEAAGSPLDAFDSMLRRMEGKSAELLSTRQRLLSRKQELDALCDRASDYRGLDLPLDELDRFSFLHFILGTVPEGRLESVSGILGGNAVLLPLPRRGGRSPLLIMTTPANRQQTETLLQQAGFQSTEPRVMEDIEAKERERDGLIQSLGRVDEQLRLFARESGPTVASIRERVMVERRLVEARQNFPRTGTTLLLSGWIPAAQADSLRSDLAAVTRNRCVIEFSEPGTDDGAAVPVALQHSAWLQPFQRMVSAYGLPFYQDFEPTLLVAISYILMFGMMFGDAGQGAILAIAGWIAMRAGRGAALKDTGRVLLLGGLSSIGFGMVYGSYFGIPALKAYALWRDPLEGDPLTLMLAAIGMGVAVISIGLVLNILNRFRRGEMTEGWLGRFGIMGVLFYWGSLALLARFAAFQSHGVAGVAALLFLALPLLGWILKEPVRAIWQSRKGGGGESGGPAVMLAESFIGVLEGVTTYLANTTSFVRLAAYAMSHAALLMAVFTVAEQIRQFSPFGGLWALLVIILGNIIAIILEGIIAAVQALRLEYYEFFGKFLSGAGLPFAPFTLTITERSVIPNDAK